MTVSLSVCLRLCVTLCVSHRLCTRLCAALQFQNVVQRLQAEENAPPPAPPQNAPHRRPVEDHDIQEIGERLRILPLTEKNLRMFDNAQRNLIPSDTCQFACQHCDKDWWRRVPQRKKVSRCHRCKTKYDPIPPDKMWGIGDFHCPGCRRSFRGFGRMDVGSPCYTCHSLLLPSQILPPRRGVVRRNRTPHSCCAEDCHNRQEPHVPGTECVHPHSRLKAGKPRVVSPSAPHISTGSTVNTCLSQGSLAELYDLILDDIAEEDEEGEGEVLVEDEEEEEEEEEDDEDQGSRRGGSSSRSSNN
ncbi:RYDEN protein, partial [Amia calva]|nr:RYDEN protein [Amia calva]